MQEQMTITCPNCKQPIPLNEAMTSQIHEKFRNEYEEKTKSIEKELAKKQQALAIKEKQLAHSEKTMNEEVAKRVKHETETLIKKAEEKAQADVAVKVKHYEQSLKEKDKKLQEVQEKELKFIKQAEELEQREKALEIEVAKRAKLEAQRLAEDARKKAKEDVAVELTDLKGQLQEKDKRLKQAQGEVLEIELEELLKTHFPNDQIEPVAKGIKGADVLQRVYSKNGTYCGTIIWESKRTKNWGHDWVDKLKDDQREAKAEVAVLMSIVLPKDVTNITNLKGVWVTSFESAMGLAKVLRNSIMQVANAKRAVEGKNEKMEVLYRYLSSAEFRQRVEAVVETFTSMREDLEKEKKALTNVWSKREKQIDRVVNNMMGMYGDMQGIIGASLPELKGLGLKALAQENTSG